MSEDPLLNGHPISTLKVAQLKDELDKFGLAKTGLKKELFERLRDHLNSQGGGGEEPTEETNEEEPARSTRSSASPRKSPTKAAAPVTPSAKTPSPTKSPAAMNKYVAQYLQNQQATLQTAKRDVEALRTNSSMESDSVSEQGGAEIGEEKETETVKSPEPEKAASPVKSPVKSPEPEKAKSPVKSPEPEKAKSPEKVKSPVPEPEKAKSPEKVKSPAPEPVKIEAPVVVPDAKKFLPLAERDEVSSTVSNAGSDIGPQAIPDDTSIPEESKEESKDEKKEEKKEESKEEEEENKEELSSSSSSSGESSSGESKEEEDKEREKSPTPKAADVEAKLEDRSLPKIETSLEEPSVELDYEEEDDHNKDNNKTNNEDETRKKRSDSSPKDDSSAPPVKKHRAIVFDLDEKSEKKDSKSENKSAVSLTRISTIVKPIVTAKPPDEPPKHGLNSLGNIRMRELSPARHDITQFIDISNLKRPYALQKLQAVLRTFGNFEDGDFWIDSMRSNCMVKYETVEQAQKARDEMHGIKWPDAPDSPTIFADFISENGFNRKRDTGSSSTDHRKGSFGINGGDKGEKSGFTIRISNDRKSSTDKKEDAEVESDGQKGEGESRKRKASPPKRNERPLDQLFKKTKAKPSIYFLPLTDENASAARAKREAELEALQKRRAERSQRT